MINSRENIAAAYWNWANDESGRGNWSAAAGHYATVAKWTRNRETAARAGTARDRAGAMHDMQRKEWGQAISKLKAVLPRQKKGNRKVVRSNIGTAYIEWGNSLFHQQAYGAALDKYEAALGVLQGDSRNLAIRNIAAAYHNLTVPHLKARRIDKAVAIMKTSVRRFPDCTPCQEELQELNRKSKASASQ